jgi:small subunit ribosomal protein S21
MRFPWAQACAISRLPSGTNRKTQADRQTAAGLIGVRTIVQVTVRDNNVDQALRALKKKLQREGVYREMKLRRHFEKPSEKKKRERAEAVRRARKLARKRAQREGGGE